MNMCPVCKKWAAPGAFDVCADCVARICADVIARFARPTHGSATV